THGQAWPAKAAAQGVAAPRLQRIPRRGVAPCRTHPRAGDFATPRIQRGHATGAGRIFGAPDEGRWMRRASRRRTVEFDNPMQRVTEQTRVVNDLLDVDAQAIMPVVIFASTARFKMPVPTNVCRGAHA